MLLAEKKEPQEEVLPINPAPQKKAKVTRSSIDYKALLDSFFAGVGNLASGGVKAILARQRVHGKMAVMFFGGIALSVVLFLTGIIGTAINNNKAKNYQQTTAMVYVLGKEAVARFKVGGYYYKIDINSKHKTGYQMPVYYTLDKNDRVDSCTFKKPSAAPYIILMAFGAASAVALGFLMLYGTPKFLQNMLKPKAGQETE